MMLEPVCIVLNEREEAKSKAASALENNLKELGVASYRLEISSSLFEMISSKQPKILVLDYLLGDISTGLDIVEQLTKTNNPPTIFLFTDEPSINVAISAFRAGVRNYFLLSEPNSLNDLVGTIVKQLASETHQQNLASSRRHNLKLEDLAFSSSPNSTLIEKLQSYVSREIKFVGLCGNPGIGKSTIARALHNSRGLPFPIHIIDLKSSTRSIYEIIAANFRLIKHSSGLAFIVENIDFDDGELVKTLDHLKSTYNILDPSDPIPLYMTFITNKKTALKNLRDRFPMECLEIPSLAQRKDDIEQYINNFVIEAEQLTAGKLQDLDYECRQFIINTDWPGELTQLRSTILSTLSCLLKKNQITKEKIQEHKDLFFSCSNKDEQPNIHPMVAASALERSNYNYRIAAIQLGCEPNQLIELISGAKE